MPSFDIVNEVNIGELENAINNTIREVTTRYDFKNSNTTVTLDRKEKIIHIVTSDDYKMETVESLIRGHCLRRKVDPKCLE